MTAVKNDMSLKRDDKASSVQKRFLADGNDVVLVTGATGFIGCKVVEILLARGFRNVRCFVRPSADAARLARIASHAQLIRGNLLSREDCISAASDASVIIHLAAARGERSFPDAFMNSVVTTRNLLEAAVRHASLRRFVNVGSFTVYDASRAVRVLDETCAIERQPELCGDAYLFAKVKQDELVAEYGRKFGVPYVIVRPGHVYGAGNEAISGRVGIGTFGLFLHLGGPNTVPLTYVDNCAEAIVLASLTRGIDGEIFNVVDDELPSSRQFLRLYKKNVKRFRSVYLPHFVSYTLCALWGWYANWSQEQLPPVFNRRRWYANWKRTRYSNEKIKARLDWSPSIATAEGLSRYFKACRQKEPRHA